MLHFVTLQEKRYWFYALLVTIGIYSSLFLGPVILKIMDTQSVQALIYGFGLGLILITIFLFAAGDEKWRWLPVIIGLCAVYMLLFLRLGMAERTHLIEYSVLTMFIDKALNERARINKQLKNPQLLTFLLAGSIGVLDEVLQIFLPDRVFDINDILFNAGAILLALIARWILQYAKKKWPVSGPPSI